MAQGKNTIQCCNLAAMCRARSQDDARDTFKTLRSQNIGDTCALLYTEWATLEAAAGHASKAVAVLQKGRKNNAQPQE
jgi:serine/threonine-protein kinase TTK/MPS1